jgi:hypothetical protein
MYDDASPESGNVLRRSFCGRCGSPVRIKSGVRPDLVAVPVGIIDGDKADFKPSIEFYCRNRAGWVGAVDGAESFDTMPPRPPQAS